MKSAFTIAFFTSFISVSLWAQQKLVLPVPSPSATLIQQVGLTEVKVEYSRPSAKGRQIFGGLVPYDQLWRTGANNAPILKIEDDILLQGQMLTKGTYALLTILQVNEEWMLIISKDTAIGGVEYFREEQELFRIPVRAQPLETDYMESFQFSFENIRANGADLVLSWERTKVFITIEVDVQSKALNNIKSATRAPADNDWRIFASAANYLVDQKIEEPMATKYLSRSLDINKNYYNYYVQGKLHAWQGKYKEAVKSMQNALQAGKSEENYKYYEDEIRKLTQVYRDKMAGAEKNK